MQTETPSQVPRADRFGPQTADRASQGGKTQAGGVLLYVRPWNTAQMAHLARGVWGDAVSVTSTSEHRAVDQSGLTDAFDTAYRQTSPDAVPRHLSEAEAEDITLRCRLLRNVDPGTARRLLVAMEHAVDQVLTWTRPSAMLSLTIDSYVMDLFATLSAKRGIRFIGLVPSFIKEHFRLSARGEYVDSRDVSEAEIDAALSTLVIKDYRPDFLVQSDSAMRRQMWRLWRRNLPKPLWFALRRLVPGEARNYHYWASQIISSRFWSLWPRQLRGISGTALEALGTDGGPPLIYLPLQMSPEATIDYWSQDTSWIDYEQTILNLVRRHRAAWRFVIKEHPNLLGYRSRGFYRRLQAEQNCVIASPSMPSNDLVGLCDGVLVCTGTAGFEAALRGKPVLSDSAPYYAPPGTLLAVATLDGGKLPATDPDPARQRALIGHVLRGTLPGRFVNDGSWSADKPQHVAWSETMAASIRGYLARAQVLEADPAKPPSLQQTSSP